MHINQPFPQTGAQDATMVERGFAVNLVGSPEELPETWVFFTKIDPALVFARAATASSNITHGHVYRAVHERRRHSRREVTYLHVNTGIALHGDTEEREALTRWAVEQNNSSRR
ncbi:hypothetical protein [Amycolatopsis sp. NPDC003861]